MHVHHIPTYNHKHDEDEANPSPTYRPDAVTDERAAIESRQDEPRHDEHGKAQREGWPPGHDDRDLG